MAEQNILVPCLVKTMRSRMVLEWSGITVSQPCEQQVGPTVWPAGCSVI